MIQSISAVLPAYNEEAVIAKSIHTMVSALEGIVPAYEIIVVDDGSRDGTAEVVRSCSQQNPKIKLVSHPQNRGYGSTLATGFTAARSPWIFMTDSDGQFDAAELGRLLPLIHDADMVIGYRQPRADPWIRRLNGWGWNTVVRVMFGYVARDVDCAFKLFRREVWDSVTVHARGATFSAELLIKARRLNFRIRELRVNHFPRNAGAATGARATVIARAFFELFKLRLTLHRDHTRGSRTSTWRRYPSATRR